MSSELKSDGAMGGQFGADRAAMTRRPLRVEASTPSPVRVTAFFSGSNFNDRTTQTALDPLAGSRFVPGASYCGSGRPGPRAPGLRLPVGPFNLESSWFSLRCCQSDLRLPTRESYLRRTY
jgi:hypothetical protein